MVGVTLLYGGDSCFKRGLGDNVVSIQNDRLAISNAKWVGNIARRDAEQFPCRMRKVEYIYGDVNRIDAERRIQIKGVTS